MGVYNIQNPNENYYDISSIKGGLICLSAVIMGGLRV